MSASYITDLCYNLIISRAGISNQSKLYGVLIMERFTKKDPDGAYRAAEGRSSDEIIRKLAEYENMHEALCAEFSRLTAGMEKLRSEGKMKTVTFRQMFSDKMLASNILGRLEFYGLQASGRK